MFGDHSLCGLLKEGAHEKSPKCFDGNLGDFAKVLNPPKIPDAKKKADPTGLLSIFPINPNSRRRRCKRPARRPNLPARQSVSAF